MSEEQKKDIREMVDIMKKLDREDILLVKGGAAMLVAKKDMEKAKERAD